MKKIVMSAILFKILKQRDIVCLYNKFKYFFFIIFFKNK